MRCGPSSDPRPHHLSPRRSSCGRDARIGEPEGGGTLRDEDELRAVFAGRPALGRTHATGHGPSARRQVRLPESTNAALDAYVAHNNTTPSAVIRDALTEYLATHKAG
ncbi:MAG: ribbon-helix-helix domain-containing protein [Micrococcales bacterium]|nr:ribbon-helix-helix domain-containing protein [Micrococcales bacterium]